MPFELLVKIFKYGGRDLRVVMRVPPGKLVVDGGLKTQLERVLRLKTARKRAHPWNHQQVKRGQSCCPSGDVILVFKPANVLVHVLRKNPVYT